MQDRFTLRFQNGEREGDTIPITSPRFTLGRRPGNTLQLQDASVSGKHAELVVEGEETLLRDLGSTNGTKVGGRKVEEARLAHGDQVSFGNVTAVFQDAELLDGAPAVADSRGSGAGAGAGDPGGRVERVSADLIAKSGKRSKLAMIGVVALLLAGGGAAAFLFTGGGGRRARKLVPVVEVAGNKLPGYSFEGDGAPEGWSSREDAPADFQQWGEARVSGGDGMRALLAAGEWARLESEPVAIPVGGTLELVGQLRARSRAAGRLGVEFLGSESQPGAGSSIAWGPWIADVTTHQEVLFHAAVPADCVRARAVVAARADDPPPGASEEEPGEGGLVDVDDVSLVDARTAGAPAARIGEYGFWLHGEPGAVLQLTKVSRTLISGLHLTGPVRLRDYPIDVSATDVGMRLGSGSATTLGLRVEPTVVAAGLASIGPTGYQELVGDFEAPDVRTLLLGAGHDLVALDFGRELVVRGRRDGDALRLSIQLEGAQPLLQVDFRAERSRAGDLAFAARKAEQNDELGECLARWNELLLSAPYEATLVQEARATRSRLEQAGLAELADVSKSFEQATFFRLVDLFRQCRARAVAVGEEYAGSEVEVQAGELIQRIDESLSGLEEDLSRDEVERLRSILAILEATESPMLAAEVRSYIDTEFGGEQ